MYIQACNHIIVNSQFYYFLLPNNNPPKKLANSTKGLKICFNLVFICDITLIEWNDDDDDEVNAVDISIWSLSKNIWSTFSIELYCKDNGIGFFKDERFLSIRKTNISWSIWSTVIAGTNSFSNK